MCHYYVSSILKYFLALLDKWLENFTCFGLLSDDDNYDFLPCDDIDGGERGPWSYSDSGKVWGKKKCTSKNITFPEAVDRCHRNC